MASRMSYARGVSSRQPLSGCGHLPAVSQGGSLPVVLCNSIWSWLPSMICPAKVHAPAVRVGRSAYRVKGPAGSRILARALAWHPAFAVRASGIGERCAPGPARFPHSGLVEVSMPGCSTQKARFISDVQTISARFAAARPARLNLRRNMPVFRFRGGDALGSSNLCSVLVQGQRPPPWGPPLAPSGEHGLTEWKGAISGSGCAAIALRHAQAQRDTAMAPGSSGASPERSGRPP